MKPPLIYNLFPRLAGHMEDWSDHAARAARMGFNWIYLNPVTQPGFSGSLYAVREHFRVCPDFIPAGIAGDGIEPLAETLKVFRSLGLRPVMDLVINHAAVDSPLVEEHPAWFLRDEQGRVVHPSAIDPADARKVTVWGDLAEIDNANSPERDGLWRYWCDLVRFYLELGFEGFRCDAAYKVPAPLWRTLASEARRVRPGARFFAETLGCRIEEVADLKGAGLDYLFNSSKYWNFDATWALDQHEEFGAIRPSISFPESHDTPRLASEVDGDLAVIRQRYLLAAVFSEGLMMPLGFEFAFRKRLHVVDSRPGDWEDTGVDLSGFIHAVNRLKEGHPVLGAEGHWRALGPFDRPTIVLEKFEGDDRVLVAINKDWHREHSVSLAGLDLPKSGELIRFAEDGTLEREAPPRSVELRGAEIALIATVSS